MRLSRRTTYALAEEDPDTDNEGKQKHHAAQLQLSRYSGAPPLLDLLIVIVFVIQTSLRE
jgi:hypothetical protein